MNLTLNALNKAKDTCEQCESYKALFEAEEQSELLVDIQNLHVTIDTTLRVLTALNDEMHALEVNGYSDEWFDSLNKDGALEGLINFDMPKFFDGPAGRAKACQEGFIDTIKDWIIKAIKFIRDIVQKIITWRMKAAQWFSDHFMKEKTENLSKQMNEVCTKNEAQTKQFFESNVINIDNYYDVAAIKKYIEAMMTLVGAIKPVMDEPFKLDLIQTGNFRSEVLSTADTSEVRRTFIELLQNKLKSENLMFNDVKKDGFVLKFDSTGKNYLEFIGQKNGTSFPTKSVTFTTAETMQKVIDEEVTSLQLAVDQMCSVHVDIYNALLNTDNKYKGELKDLMDKSKNTDISAAAFKSTQINIAVTQCALVVATQVGKFIDACNAAARANLNLLEQTLEIVRKGIKDQK